MMTRRAGALAMLLTSAGLVGLSAASAWAQARVVVPIIIQAPRAGAPLTSRPSSVHVTTRSASPQPGVTATQVTVSDTTGAVMRGGPAPGVTRQLTTVGPGTQTILVTVDRRLGPDGSGAVGTTQVTVEDVSHANRTLRDPAPIGTLRAASPGQQTVTITSEAPIDAPIVVLTP